MRLIDLKGKRFGRLVVIERASTDRKAGHAMWKCKCDCGRICVKGSYELRNGQVKSCGCLMREWCESPPPNKTHGMSKSRLYRIWRGMLSRCLNEGNSCYKDYGGRGIQVCCAWRDSFESFFKWAFDSGYSEGLSIDRIDVNGDYAPENCRWVPMSEQAHNQRKTVYLSYRGEWRPLWEWAKITGIPLSLLHGRVNRGWPLERIFNEPAHTECRNHRVKKN